MSLRRVPGRLVCLALDVSERGLIVRQTLDEYVDMTPGRNWTVANTLDRLRDDATNPAIDRDFHESALAKLFPFMEQMGRWQSSLKESWWEREWRHVGHLELPVTGVIWLCPEDEISQINDRVGRELIPWLDPRWGLEEIIAHLSGFLSARSAHSHGRLLSSANTTTSRSERGGNFPSAFQTPRCVRSR